MMTTRGRRARTDRARWFGVLVAAAVIFTSPYPGAVAAATDTAATVADIPQTTIISASQTGRFIQVFGSSASAEPFAVEIATSGGAERGLLWHRAPVFDTASRPLGWRVTVRAPLADDTPVIVSARTVDRSGAVDPSPAVFQVMVDAVPPVVEGLEIDGGGLVTNSQVVSVRSRVRDAAMMRIVTDERQLYGAPWVAYAAEATVALPPGDGTKLVMVQYADERGNETDIRDAQVQVTLDRTAPSIVGVEPARAGLDLIFDEAVMAPGPVDLTVSGRPVKRVLQATGNRSILHLPFAGLTSGAQYDLSLPRRSGVMDLAGNQVRAGSIRFRALDTLAPSAPPSLEASGVDALVRLDWTAASDDVEVAGYRVYRSAAPLQGRPSLEFLVGETGALGYLDDSGVSNEVYYYAVGAVDTNGNEGSLSSAVRVRVGIKGMYHGEQTESTNICKDCHSQVAEPGVSPEQAERRRCLSCHDGTGSRHNVAAGLGSAAAEVGPEGAAEGLAAAAARGVVTSHVAGDGGLRCSDCHTPHRSPSQVPRLLSIKAPDGTRVSGGPRYCLVCHEERSTEGQGARKRVSSSRYASSGHAALPVPSGTRVSCGACHRPHASSQPALLARAEAELCLDCHTASRVSGPLGWDVAKQFAERSRHAVEGTTADGLVGAALSCSSCHDSHLARRGATGLSDPASRLIDPATRGGTASPWTAEKGTMTDFCLACHRSATEGVPLPPIAFPIIDAARFPMFPGWDKTAFVASAHGTASGSSPGDRLCTACHQPHGSPNARTLVGGEDTSATAGLCLSCHDGSRPGVPDIKAPLVKASRHPTLDVSGRHSDIEGPQELGFNGGSPDMRHAECADCHDVHSARGGRHKPGSAAAGPSVEGAVGVRVTRWPGAPLSGPGSLDLEAVRLSAGISEEWQLCFKCHSSYTTLGSTRSAGNVTRDIAAEFNPVNGSYHGAVGPPKADARIAFVPGSVWAATSRMTCTDCHSGDDVDRGGAAGPHGSDNEAILARPFTGRTGEPGTDGDLCFSCHDRGVYGGSDDPSRDVSRTAFADASRNLHSVGAAGAGHRVACVSCHAAVVHGARMRALLVAGDDTSAARATGSPGVTLTAGMPEPGAWTFEGCSHEGACHDR